jgi:TIR domain
METPIVFISYSWDSEPHKEWVLNLANQLRKNGVDVILDQYDLSAGMELTHFLEKGVSADKILVIMTPNYKIKADKRTGGVGYEYSMLSEEYFEGEPNKAKILPILRSGDKKSSCPTFMRSIVYHEMIDDGLFDTNLFKTIKLILGKPLVEKPPLGQLPNFDGNKIPDLEKTIKEFQDEEKFQREKKSFLLSTEGFTLFAEETNKIIRQIEESIENFKKNFNFKIWSKKTKDAITITTGNYTFHFERQQGYVGNEFECRIKMNFFEGPVGFDDISFINALTFKKRYLNTLKFDLDANSGPVFTDIVKRTFRLASYDVATIALRELITNELRLAREKLSEL